MDKQVEEKAKIISDICPFYKEYGSCDKCNTDLDIEDPPCYWECVANAIIGNSYRKQVEGHWLNGVNGSKVCSMCGKEPLYTKSGTAFATTFYKVKSNYCPNRGAKMKGDKTDA